MLKEAIAVLMLLNAVSGKDYCSVCRDHTMCVYEGIGSACEDAGQGGVSREEISEIVKKHNELRRKVATGMETRGAPGPQPKAANMLRLTWNKELALIAQKWADQCTFGHDSCRDIDTETRIGQNVYWSYQYPLNEKANWTKAINSWFDEVELFNSQSTGRFRFDSSYGHYSQIVWADTNTIGCGKRNYGLNKIYVCNYGPAGNMREQPMYLVGEPCSACPKDSTCRAGICELKPFKKIIIPRIAEKNNDSHSLEGEERKPNWIKDSFPTEYEYGEHTTTELPVDFNIINAVDQINNDDEIKSEIEDLKTRIRQLIAKIISRKNSRN